MIDGSKRNARLWELVLVFVIAPGLLALGPRWLVSLAIITSGALSLVVLLGDRTFSRSALWDWQTTKQGLKRVLLRTGAVWAALFVFTVVFYPDRLFEMPHARPRLWLLVMLIYPGLSAYSQELMYRTLFFHRYGMLFERPRMRVLASGILFGWGHIVVHDGTALGLATLGGLMFAATYERHRSTLLVAIEHGLYGDFIFTVGLGRLFYNPRPWLIR